MICLFMFGNIINNSFYEKSTFNKRSQYKNLETKRMKRMNSELQKVYKKFAFQIQTLGIITLGKQIAIVITSALLKVRMSSQPQLIITSLSPGPTPQTSYSTIFHCDQSPAICILRGLQGLIALTVFIQFTIGYKKMTRQRHNPISKQDKSIYMLAMWQTLLLSLYYLLFEQFVILATIRNFLIWIAINILHVMCKIYWISDDRTLQKVGYGVTGLQVVNVVWWFVFSLGEGSAVDNNDFNLGYNCHLVGWTALSGFLLIVVTFEAYIALNIYDRLSWQRQQTDPENKRHLESIDNQSFQIIAIVSCNFIGALIMFLWDFYAYSFSSSDQDCTDIFVGNTFFRQVLCFLFKIVSMQLSPCMIYYIIYHTRKNQFLDNFQQQNQQNLNVDLLDDNASEFNRTITSRVESRRSLFSQTNQHGGSQYL